MTEHPEIPATAHPTHPAIPGDRVPKAYDAYRNAVLTVLETLQTGVLSVEQTNSTAFQQALDEIRDMLATNDVKFLQLAANMANLIPFLEKLVANADQQRANLALEKEVLEKINRELSRP